MGDIQGVSVCARGRWDEASSDQMMDALAHDANVRKDGEHIHARATARTHAEVRAHQRHEREDAGHQVSELAQSESAEIAGHGGEWALERAAHHLGSMALGRAASAFGAAGVVVAAPLTLGSLFREAILDAHHKGAQLRYAQDNDALNAALASRLAFDPAFAASQVRARSDVQHGTAMVLAALDGKDKDMVPVLQARADQGALAAKRALDDAARAPADRRGEVFQRSLEAQGVAARVHDDIAFGKGVEYVLWLHLTQPRDRLAKEIEAVNARTVQDAHRCAVRG